MKNIDWHLHTTASDGSFTPEQLVVKAAEKGLTSIAVTDHDTVEGILPARNKARSLPLEVIPGIELTAYIDQLEVHILGYFIDYLDNQLLLKLSELREMRRQRGKKIVKKLNQLGIDLTWQEVKELTDANQAIGRPHIAQALQQGGYVQTAQQAFDKYLEDQGPAYVPKTNLTPREAIEMIKQVKGIAVLAHPGLLADQSVVPELIEAGIEGLEVYYSKHNSNQISKYVRLAKDKELLILGGSDCHGLSNQEQLLLGNTKVPDWLRDRLQEGYRARRGIEMIDFNKYLALYPQTSGLYPQKLAAIGQKYHQQGYLTKEQLYQLAYLNSTRSAYHVKKNAGYLVKKVTQEVYQLEEEFLQLELLSSLSGVGIPTASAILTSLDEESHCVIDTRVWATLWRMGYFEQEKESFKASDYLRIIDIVRRLAEEVDLTVAEIGYALFAYDVEHREGTLH
ncbi:PHP domain-containing protein [Fuchsiella alkaliacetigena]|uniref:PHP domain-containing protein n=1 Tax=Fuchsiella alkaliacetigena TaxID=957042 RepID=UPI00200B820B|nr:PHP domain-containing protein [Fuchsiella alkaliacetigena]MCK8824161.1 PHP domain-containing protein [Fuchsiella alkaliacetigena]